VIALLKWHWITSRDQNQTYMNVYTFVYWTKSQTHDWSKQTHTHKTGICNLWLNIKKQTMPPRLLLHPGMYKNKQNTTKIIKPKRITTIWRTLLVRIASKTETWLPKVYKVYFTQETILKHPKNRSCTQFTN